MTLLLRPRGRGNWKPIIVTIEGSKHAPVPIEVCVGDLVTIAGRILRVRKVWA